MKLRLRSFPTVLLVAACACTAATAVRAASSRSSSASHSASAVANGEKQPDAPATRVVTYLGLAVEHAGPELAAQLRLPEGRGLVVNVVAPDSPAEKAGLQRYDVLTRLDDQILIGPRQLAVLVRNHQEGDAVTITYLRAGAEAQATVTLGKHEAPADLGRNDADPPDVFFRRGFFHPAPAFEGFPTTMPKPPPPPHVGPGPHGSRTMIFRPERNIVFADDAGMLELMVDGNQRTLTARDEKGDVIFSGPVNTSEQKAALPPEVRKRFHELERAEVIEPPPPPMGPPPSSSGKRGPVI